jgi:hypothetical protein
MILHCVDPDQHGSYQIERKDPHQSDKLDPDPDPHKIDKLNPDPVPHQLQMTSQGFKPLFGSYDPDPHQSER